MKTTVYLCCHINRKTGEVKVYDPPIPIEVTARKPPESVDIETMTFIQKLRDVGEVAYA